MAVLLEGMTLVFENATLEAKHPEGLYGFILAWDNGSFCTDSTISRLSFFEIDDGFSVFMAMQDMGLDVNVNYAEDVAVFTHGGGLWAPCLWLETGISAYGYAVCWHTAEKMGKISVPTYFNMGATLAKFQGLTADEVSKRMSWVGLNNNVSTFRDRESNILIYGPRFLCRH